MIFVIGFELGDEFLDGFDGCGFVGSGEEGIFLLFLEILFSEGELFVVAFGVILMGGQFTGLGLATLH